MRLNPVSIWPHLPAPTSLSAVKLILYSVGESYGPMAATYKHLDDPAWQRERLGPEGYITGIRDQGGGTWRLHDAVAWYALKDQNQNKRIQAVSEIASHHKSVEGLADGADVTVAQKHYEAGKHRNAKAFMTTCSGAFWSSAKLHEAGIITAEEVKCLLLCGEADAKEGHVFW